MTRFTIRTAFAVATAGVLALTLLGHPIRTEAAPIVLLEESFEADDEGTRWTSTGEFRDSVTTYFMRTNNLSSSGQDLPGTTSSDRRYNINGDTSAYTGFHGSFVWAGENVDGSSGTRSKPAVVTLNAVDISGYSDVVFTGLFGGTVADADDYMRVSYSLDGGGFTQALYFRTTAASNGQPLALDTDDDGRGDPGLNNVNVLGSAMKEFSFSIPAANTVSIRLEMFADAGADEFAFDYFRLSTIPEPASVALVSMGLLLMTTRSRRRAE